MSEETKNPSGFNILTIPAVVLSIASVVWTTYSVLDLLVVGRVAVTVAATLDLAWISLQYAQHKRIPLMGSRVLTEVAGWTSLGVVIGLLIWHGISLEGKTLSGVEIDGQTSLAIAIAGPLLPMSAKLVMMLAAARLADPTSLTSKEEDHKTRLQRRNTFRQELREQYQARERMDHEAYLQRQEAERDRQKAQAERERQKVLDAHQEEMDRLTAQREQATARAEAELEELRAKTRLETARLEAETAKEIELIRADNERRMALAQGEFEVDEMIFNRRREINRRQSFIIGETVPQPALRSVPAKSTPRGVTMSVESLTTAQENRKRLALGWWMAKKKADEEGLRLTQTQFAADNGVSQAQLSRAISDFPTDQLDLDETA